MIEESQIRQRAYELWERDARPDGAEEYYWRLAQDQLENESQQTEPPAGSQDDGMLEAASTQQIPEQHDQPGVQSEWPAKGEASRSEHI